MASFHHLEVIRKQSAFERRCEFFHVVIVLLMNPAYIRRALIYAKNHGMTTGEYAYLAIDMLHDSIISADPPVWQDRECYSFELTKAMSLFKILLSHIIFCYSKLLCWQ